ncbi:MAG TPA: hypothetical protein VK602_01170, partial [Phyllobacterium sp.]|nr:hypothetical protein [Phyllobacterium sp.]
YQPYSHGNNTSAPNRPVGYTGDTGPYEPTSSDRNATVIDSAPIEQLVANSTIDIADTLRASRSRWQSYKTLIAVLSAIFVVAAFSILNSAPAVSPAAAFIATAGAVIILGAIWVHGLQSSTVSLDYNLSSEESERFVALTRAFGALAGCSRIWRIPLEKQQADWKRNAGASKTVERKQVSLTKGNPPLVKSNVAFLQLPLGKETVYFTPDAILVVAGNAVAALRYNDVEIVCRQTRFIEDDAAPSDAKVVGDTWRYINRDGSPDRRFSNNRKLPICLYGEIDFKSDNGLNERINCSRVDVSEGFATTAAAMRVPNLAASNMLDNSSMDSSRIAAEQNQSNGIVDVGTAYAQETDLARSLALNHGKLWEFLLVEELLRSKLQSLKSDCDNLVRIVPKRLFTGREFVHWISSECNELSSAITNMAACIDKGLMDALGEPGVPGDAIKILGTVNSLFHNCRSFLHFESALSAAEVPSGYYELKDSFRGVTVSVVRVIEDLNVQWSRNTEALRNGAQKFELKIHFISPPQLQTALEAFERIKKKPELF